MVVRPRWQHSLQDALSARRNEYLGANRELSRDARVDSHQLGHCATVAADQCEPGVGSSGLMNLARHEQTLVHGRTSATSA